ncbi:hypothetical protein FDC45_15600 [Clostridium botulinum]|uniref:Uncharacterized protein n=1 Tax=Clostridium botulinum TaxID=1491 RepID=A0A846J498_CLOBO|nr:hypothetical protein [Clostridium botulinum]ACA55853.1 hypothetical protein CLK_1318 [Clostridium botulinum A3 str. Loch Maree]NFH66125.1 hypothetical protein [Clostridium botulinum]NFJ08728.1 hypothetical protein [Clostridium botulinum]NFK15124.1 hypothetical protein [Clostridium botulinum]NFM93084.1 hypothetical protein [Clostridium botulinum]
MEYIGIEKFGSFLDNGAAYTIPDRPWFTDNYPGSLSERGKGNIRAIADRHEISLGNTLSNENSQIPWIHLKDGLKHIYVCKQVLATNISWDYLNERNMIYGTPVTIDGKQYKLRVLTGGVERNPDKPGMVPTDNEWDTIIQNTANITGLPKPTTEDLTEANTYGQLDGKHNQHWNWWGINTICQETRTLTSSKITRGYSSAASFTSYDAIALNSACGWRPVLEYIETDPPEKPTIVKPTGTETKPSVTNVQPIQIETIFNNPDGTFKHMDYEVWDLDLNKRVANTRVFITNDVLTPKLELGHRYKLIVSHTNTADQVSPQATSYFMRGILNKYKLSEPVTQKQYDKLTAYTSGDDLIMKPQQFPETENSVIRLVPQTMNNLTAGETTTKELPYSASTKALVIGDRLIKNKEVYTVAEVKQGNKPINVNSTIYKILNKDKPMISWTYRSGTKSYTYNGYAYVSYLDLPYFQITGIPLQGGETKYIWTGTTENLRNMVTTGKGNMMYTIKSTEKETNLIATNLDTGLAKQTLLPRDNDQIALSAVVDSRTNRLVLSAKERCKVTEGSSTTYKYTLMCYWFDVSDLDNIKMVQKSTILANCGYTELGNPTIEDMQDIYKGNICIYYPRVTEDKCELKEHRYDLTSLEGVSTLGIVSDVTDALDTEIVAKHIKDKQGESILVVSMKYPSLASSGNIRTLTMKKGGTLYSNTLSSGTAAVRTHKITYSHEQGIGLVYATSVGNIYKRFTKDYTEWGNIEFVFSVTPRAGLEQVFETVDYYPESYGKYPGLAILEYTEATKTDKLVLRADYTNDKEQASKIILDKPITAQAGEKIKYLDYDLEVKAGEETATIKPTDITEDYYEYDAQFTKEEAQRDINIKGRNTKLTTLYYYNY